MTLENTLIVSGNFKSLAEIADFVSTAATRAGLNDRATYAMQMAVDEACSNIIEHAYGGESDSSIKIKYAIRVDGLEITIFDFGHPFAPDHVPLLNPQAPLKERGSRGMGLFFIQNLMDGVDYNFSPVYGNQLKLFKRK